MLWKLAFGEKCLVTFSLLLNDDSKALCNDLRLLPEYPSPNCISHLYKMFLFISSCKQMSFFIRTEWIFRRIWFWAMSDFFIFYFFIYLFIYLFIIFIYLFLYVTTITLQSLNQCEPNFDTWLLTRVVKKTVFFISCFFQEKNMFFSCFFRFFRFFFLAYDFFIFKDLTYGYCKLMMLFKTQTFLLY